MIQLEQFCNFVPDVYYLPDFDSKQETDWFGVKGLWYKGATYQGKQTKIYACIGYPKVKGDEQVPAVVCVHGGGGHAYAEWVKQWNKRGFAAIAMDTTGYFPSETWKGLVGTEEPGDEDARKYTRTLYGALAEKGYTVGPDNSGMKDYNAPVHEQWMYHAIAGTILAHNILRSAPHVNPNKIGICGISWGAVIASLAIGYDNRFAFAVPIYGSGYLGSEPCPQLSKIFAEPTVRLLWSASDRFDRVAFPVLWKCWTGDTCFSIVANSKSYLATKSANSYLSISTDWNHSHYHGWHAPETYRFARAVVEGCLPLIKTIEEPEGFGKIDFPVAVPEDFEDLSANIYYLSEMMEYDENNKMTAEWKCVPVAINRKRVNGRVPEGAYCYFVEMRGFANGICYTTDSGLHWKRMVES